MGLNPSAVTGGVRRLIACFDGTWNTAGDNTNVARIYSAIADRESGNPHQLKFYDEGVGTASDMHVRGGAFGWGLDRNILEGYCWLINQYGADGEAPGDEREPFANGPDIFIFGFSRGAYTARSLGGLVNRCGIVRREHFGSEPGGLAHVDAPIVREAWALYRREYPADVEARYERECIDFRAGWAWNVRIKFIGVWDTVGALGVPMFSKTVLARAKYGFHDTALGRIVENAFHAVAIDEQRADYAPTLWTKKRDHQNVEQRWFPGAHANVGGGYENDRLYAPPLKWMADRAAAAGLELDEAKLALRGDEYLSPVVDSYAMFMFGAYQFFRTLMLRGRHYRPMLTQGIAETIDETARRKWQNDRSYRPPNLPGVMDAVR